MGSSFSSRQASAGVSAERLLIPENEEDRHLVLEQLERLLVSPLFSNSRRYPNLLKYIVEETLAGRAGNLKERTIGIEVFGRDPTYDTNLDPVVRTSAAQVRQRVSQYYLEPGRESEIRIDLVPGSYVPQFRHRSPTGIAPAAVPEVNLAALVVPLAVARKREPWKTPAIALAAIVCGVAGFFILRWALQEPANAFWGVVLSKSTAVVICVPGKFPLAGTEPGAHPLSIADSLHLNAIAYPDATTLYLLAGFLQQHGQPYQVRRDGDSALADFRMAPSLFIGGFNNDWLLRLTSRYRFTYRRETTPRRGWIRDAQNPAKRDWKVDFDAPYASFDEDYGVISRVLDPTTERIVVVASGIAAYGTIAAGEFLTNPKYLDMLGKSAPSGWEKKNIQVVFSTKVFNGNAGPPKILVTHVW